MTTAPQGDVTARTFRITHPFHPWHGRQFELVAYKSAWGENRVYFYNEQQQLTTIAASWTDFIAGDPFVVVSAGRAVFRAEDLLELAGLVRRLLPKGGRDV
ncbi:MAG: DUF5372 family protein [Acidobacteriota bacterium]